jgi:hypothetical protein
MDCPVARPNAALRRVMGLLLRESGRLESKTLLSGPLGIRAISSGSEAAEPRGARETECRCRLPRSSKRQQIVQLRIQGVDAGVNGVGLNACAGSEVALVGASDYRAVKLLSTQIVRKQAKAFLSPTTPHIACNVVVNAFQQYERLARLATAKLERRPPILGLAHPPLREMPRIHWGFMIGAC